MKIATKAQRNHAWVQHGGGGMLGAATTRPVVPVTQARVPALAAQKAPTLGVTWRCSACGRNWPVWLSANGDFAASLDYADGWCKLCAVEGRIYDPAKAPGTPGGKPALQPGEYAVEYQLKRKVWSKSQEYVDIVPASGIPAVRVPLGPVRSRGTYTSSNPHTQKVASYFGYSNQVFFDGEYTLDPPRGYIVRDYDSLDCVLRQLNDGGGTSRPRQYLRCVDHAGAHLKLDALVKVFPQPPPSPAIIHKAIAELLERDPPTPALTADERVALLRLLCGDYAVIAEDGLSAEVTPVAERVDAYERRRERIRRDGAPHEPTRLFHGTCAHNVPSVLREGLRLGVGGALGPGIYFGQTDKAVNYAGACHPQHWVPDYGALDRALSAKYTYMKIVHASGLKHEDRLTAKMLTQAGFTRPQMRRLKVLERLQVGFECSVLLGTPYTVQDALNGDEMKKSLGRALGRGHSVFWPKALSQFNHDEWAIYRRDQVLIRRVVVLGERPPRPKD